MNNLEIKCLQILEDYISIDRFDEYVCNDLVNSLSTGRFSISNIGDVLKWFKEQSDLAYCSTDTTCYYMEYGYAYEKLGRFITRELSKNTSKPV